ncbi:METTL16 [Cordylochernes scorpioides]|uniref:METTL16 n=1 Tax=Cordylochernes scorpioides TaxID=51811 RepID=A0ABY6KFE3_9ARAC|nr:METTL16 [Cordylochernes scorpioides]UYV66931.1 METTL16 [Cordylochernes scorpioides]
MTFNKYIHPRNIYRKPPDFQQLAIKYPDFQKHVKIGLNGEATLDFENPEALRVLTKTLLKNDFNLEINIPEHRLIPTMTLRLNYILWIEDLLKLAPQQQPHIIGLDIGMEQSLGVTGARASSL